MKKIAIYAFVAAMAAMTTSCGSKTDSNAQATDEYAEAQAKLEAVSEKYPVDAFDKTSAAIIDLADDNLLRPDTKVETLTVLDFNAVWCVPCKKLTPAFHKAADTLGDKVIFYSVDIDKNPETAKAFNIEGVPTVVFLVPDGAPQSFVGLNPFIGDTEIEGLSPDQLTDLIYGNLVKLIDNANK